PGSVRQLQGSAEKPLRASLPRLPQALAATGGHWAEDLASTRFGTPRAPSSSSSRRSSDDRRRRPRGPVFLRPPPPCRHARHSAPQPPCHKHLGSARSDVLN